MAIAVVLSCKMDDTNYSIVLDTVGSTTIQGNTSITTHPLITGDVVADHMYRNPVTINIEGTFGMNIKSGVLINNEIKKLNEIEAFFEKIKNEGILCDMAKIQINDDNLQDIRFLQRSNLLLNTIQWTEKINTLGYSFSFQEIAFAQSIEYDVANDDENMPNIAELSTRSFSEILIDKSELLGQVVKILYDENLMSESFFEGLRTVSSDELKKLGIGIVVGSAVAILTAVIAAGIIAIAGGSAAGPIGTLVGVIVAVAAIVTTILVLGIQQAIKWIQTRCKYSLKPFNKWKEKEFKRFAKFILSMNDEVSKINDTIKVRGFTDDKDQEAVLSINNTYYVYKFTTNNLNNSRTLEIKDIDGKTVGKGMSDIRSAPTDYGKCNSGNCVFKDEENNIYISLVYIGEDNIDEKNKMTNYVLVIAPFKPEEFGGILANIIKQYMMK